MCNQAKQHPSQNLPLGKKQISISILYMFWNNFLDFTCGRISSSCIRSAPFPQFGNQLRSETHVLRKEAVQEVHHSRCYTHDTGVRAIVRLQPSHHTGNCCSSHIGSKPSASNVQSCLTCRAPSVSSAIQHVLPDTRTSSGRTVTA